MGKIKDLTGQKFHQLTVIKDSGKRTPSRSVVWVCQCECGKIIEVSGNDLKRKDNKAKKDCGDFLHRTSQGNLIGKKINHFFIEGLLPYNKETQQKTKWICKCDCGNPEPIYLTTWELTREDGKAIQSCGCSKRINEIGNRYGKLTVINYAGIQENTGSAQWECLCDCGNKVIYSGKNLRNGRAISCGCQRSKGESLIKNILSNLQVDYFQEYKFKDLLSNKNYPLRFDFAIFKNNVLKLLIEYQGSQHYDVCGFSKTVEEQKETLARDQQKRNYCKDHNIPLVEIPYTDFNIIDQTYIINILKEYDIL